MGRVLGNRKTPLRTNFQHHLGKTVASLKLYCYSCHILLYDVSRYDLFCVFLCRYGRRPLLLVSYLGSILFSLLSAFSTSYIMFVIMRFFTGVALAGIAIISFVLSKHADLTLMFHAKLGLLRPGVDVSADVEWVSIEHRTFSGIIICLDVTIGNCIGVGIAYCVNEWRMLILAVTSPLVLSVIAWRYFYGF